MAMFNNQRVIPIPLNLCQLLREVQQLPDTRANSAPHKDQQLTWSLGPNSSLIPGGKTTSGLRKSRSSLLHFETESGLMSGLVHPIINMKSRMIHPAHYWNRRCRVQLGSAPVLHVNGWFHLHRFKVRLENQPAVHII